MNRRLLIISGVVVAALAIFAVYLSRQRLRRARAFRGAAAVERAIRPPAVQPVPPVEKWTEQFAALQAAGEWDALDDLLDAIETRSPDLYGKWSLGYLHARTLIESDEPDEAGRRLAPFLQTGSPFRDLALFHQAEIEEARGETAAASQARQTLVREAPKSLYRNEAIDAELESLSESGDADALIRFAAALSPGEPTSRRRELESRVAEALVEGNARRTAYEKALAIIRADTTDDAAERAARVLDRAEFLRTLDGPQLAALGEALRNHRHFDRAVEVLRLALPRMPAGSPERDDVLFGIGRSHFGAERYPAAMQMYLAGANSTRDPKQKATYLFHASRAAQLTGDDAAAERLMTAAIAVPGRFPATTAALTQRIRTRLQKNRRAEAAADLELLRRIAPNDHALVDGALAFAVSGKEIATSALGTVPPALLDKQDQPEFAYWRGRAAEGRDPSAAFREYLRVLRATVPSHFAYLARDRLRVAPLNARRRDEIALRDRQIAQLLSQQQFAAAKDVATDRYLLSSDDLAAATRQLAQIYREIPEYKAILDLAPDTLPSFPGVEADRASLLMAMGLFDEAIDEIRQRYPLRPMASALTQAVALNRAGASRESIYAVEVLMKSVPADFAPDLLPRL
ncbi:MAG TPA: hypothetical protein VFL80_01530, partial [Thermoanaerobaculia bacterium]|nr:hypothetical protein [Thermoanaerobaculia bacterium]